MTSLTCFEGKKRTLLHLESLNLWRNECTHQKLIIFPGNQLLPGKIKYFSKSPLRPPLGRAEFRAGTQPEPPENWLNINRRSRDISSQLIDDFRRCLIKVIIFPDNQLLPGKINSFFLDVFWAATKPFLRRLVPPHLQGATPNNRQHSK